MDIGISKMKSDKTIEKVEKILAKVRPYIQMHGGDVSLIDVKDGIVTLAIHGACSHCSLADLTYNSLIAGLLKQEIKGIKEVRLQK